MASPACGQGVEPGVSASAQPAQPAAGGAPRRRIASTTAPVFLEFDLPDEFSSKTGDGAYLVTGFRVGYFSPTGSEALHTEEFTRDGLKLHGQTVNVSLPRVRLPENVDQVVFRVQTLTRGKPSAWSEPSPVTTSIALPPATGRQRASSTAGGKRGSSTPRDKRGAATPREKQGEAGTAATPPREKQGAATPRGKQSLSLPDLERHTRLVEALRKLLPPEAKVDEALTGFRRAEDLAVAVVISRDHNVPFVDLHKTLQGPPRQSLRNALRQLLPKVQSGPAIAKARTDSRQLLEESPTKPPPPK